MDLDETPKPAPKPRKKPAASAAPKKKGRPKTTRAVPTTSLGLTIPTTLYERLRDSAKERNVSMAFVATTLIDHGLDKLTPVDQFKLIQD